MATNTTTTKNKNGQPNYLGNYLSGSYTPSYDYVSDYYKPNAGYVNPSRYGYRSSMYNIPTQYGFAAPMKDGDDAWNIGSLLGSLWGARYNKKGAEKSTKTASDMLEEYNNSVGMGNGVPATEQNSELYQKAQAANAIPDMPKMTDPNAPAPKAEDLGKGAGQGNVQTPDYGSLQDAIRQGYKNQLSAFNVSKYYKDGQVQDNPESDKKDGMKVGNAVAGDISNIDVSKLPQGYNSDLLRARIISKLRADGRNEWQIGQAMQSIEPQILEKQREYNDNSFGQMYQQYQSLLADNKYDDAGMLYAKMAQMKPEYAKVLETQYNKQYTNFAENEKLQKKIDLIKKADPSLSDREALSAALGYKKGVLGGSGGRATTAAEDIYGNGSGWTKQDKAQLEYLTKMYQEAEKNGKKLPAHLAQKYAELTNKFLGIGFQPVGGGNENPTSANGVNYSNIGQVESIAARKLNSYGNKFTSNDVLNIAQELRKLGTDAGNSVAIQYEEMASRLAAEENEETSQKGNPIKDFLMREVDAPRTKNDSIWNGWMDKFENRNKGGK